MYLTQLYLSFRRIVKGVNRKCLIASVAPNDTSAHLNWCSPARFVSLFSFYLYYSSASSLLCASRSPRDVRCSLSWAHSTLEMSANRGEHWHTSSPYTRNAIDAYWSHKGKSRREVVGRKLMVISCVAYKSCYSTIYYMFILGYLNIYTVLISTLAIRLSRILFETLSTYSIGSSTMATRMAYLDQLRNCCILLTSCCAEIGKQRIPLKTE